MKKILCAISFLLLVVSNSGFSNTEMLPQANLKLPLFLTFGVGQSWSGKAGVSVNTNFWDPSPQGYNANLGNSEFYQIGIETPIYRMLSMGLAVIYHPDFKYSKFQTSDPASGTPGFLGTKTRFFDLSNTSIMVNFAFNKFGKNYRWHIHNDITLAPFISAGIGVAYNNMTNFHSISQPAPGSSLASARSIMTSHTETSLAYQFTLGLLMNLNKRLSIDTGYRYFNGGDFTSNNYITDVLPGLNSPVSAPAWKGTLKANEVFINLNYAI